MESNIFEELHPPLTAEQAVFEASRCLECGGPYAQAPCILACPTHIDIPKFIREIRLGDPQASAHTIFEANILGGQLRPCLPCRSLMSRSLRAQQRGPPTRVYRPSPTLRHRLGLKEQFASSQVHKFAKNTESKRERRGDRSGPRGPLLCGGVS